MSKDVIKYGESDSEVQLQERIKAREIVHEILNFGVSETQKIQIIYLISLELDNRELMLEIGDPCKNYFDSEPNTTQKILI